ncbi:BREX system Lon protease-like protein BrxL [Bifidobacterium parmae]|uniref:ATP-dependent Lon protease n=1 Tax=Bifidobacterium parmae TaxID=361854 RepID=A0A2N5IZD4_9BIFI|nr:BREX system Lon protease-like protein BrxL [Bifidobacterium parmae]PLS27307.1 ATP-dependent Lon protease [Bifidobacterium parmae]
MDYASKYEKYFALSPTLSTRDKDGVRKTFSGLMKLIYPSGEATMEEMEPLLRCAIEGRKRVKDQLCRIDSTMAEVDFSYMRVGSPDPIAVHAVEEDDYPDLYWRGRSVPPGAPETMRFRKRRRQWPGQPLRPNPKRNPQRPPGTAVRAIPSKRRRQPN